MNLNEYQKLAQRTSATIGADKIKNGCFGLIGETGEIVDALKKWLFQSGENPPFPKEKFIKEMGDVLWYCAEVISGIKTDNGLCFSMESMLGGVSHFWKDISKHDIEDTVVTLNINASWVYTYCFANGAVTPRESIKDSIRDVYGSLLDVCALIGTTIDEVANTNIEKLKKRYPDGFDPERSMHRPEYQNSEEGNGGSTEGMLFNARNHLV